MGAYGSYAQELRQLMPCGAAWCTDDGTRMGALIDALAVELERVDGRVQAMLSEAHPSLADELLPEYAAIFGVDETAEACGAAYATRRRQDGAYYQTLAAACGFTSGVTIAAAPAPFSCVSTCIDALFSWHDRSVLVVDAAVLGEGNTDILISVFEAAKQLHWVWIWHELVDYEAAALGVTGVVTAEIAWPHTYGAGELTYTGSAIVEAVQAAIDAILPAGCSVTAVHEIPTQDIAFNLYASNEAGERDSWEAGVAAYLDTLGPGGLVGYDAVAAIAAGIFTWVDYMTINGTYDDVQLPALTVGNAVFSYVD
jgi:uncharacterized protein YmfQ (DUF2313 family)